ncbi:ATP-binding protein [Mucilaginibacter terrae]|uniref:SpoVK/Ycf46/Vps4 family AAA+-type ATPase n=1 Tax=Mucilaginibacter terrae TaxID=1955052 RepID=A0ABU3GP48_9SPHI|nr:ATP-binding protein [Mucilaginibacter terrae]MDT3401241.1 SpoVK/Ycf46/Vps4 family AAA+-type ATPase [Mucilaginibacter terrae]
MQHFNIIQALCRSALANPTDAIVHQIKRLKEALEKDGQTKEVNSLNGILNSSQANLEMAPSKIQKSFVLSAGETLTRKTVLPVDKETSTALVEVFFDDDLPAEPPIFSHEIQIAIEAIINEWVKFEQLIQLQAIPASSCLIYGSPGTGKTHLAKWIAKQIGLPVVLARLEGLMSSFLGTTSRNIGNLFAFANRYNCVLLLDEFDAIAKLRNDPQEVGEVKRVVNTLLQSLDSRHERGFTIGVTNHETLLDPAIWRRFDIQMQVPKPSTDVLLHLITKLAAPLNFSETELKFLAWSLEDSSGADAKMLVQWLKRVQVINPDSELVPVMRQFVLLNAGRISGERRDAMVRGDETLIQALLADKTFGFKQKDIAPLLNMAPSSISKLLSRTKEN